VGPDTIRNLHRNRAAALVVEAGEVLVVDREEMLELADRLGIVVVGHRSEE